MSKQAMYDRGFGRDYATVTIGEKTKDGKIVIHDMLKGRDAERWIKDNVGDFDPPDFLPTREPLPPRVPDLCTDDWQKEPCVCHEQSGPCMHCCRGIVP